MRYAISMTMIVCAACIALSALIGRLDAAAGDATQGVVMQPPTTQAELDILRAERLREERLRGGGRPTAILAYAAPDEAVGVDWVVGN